MYPYACNNTQEWPAEAASETGLSSKAEYQKWCHDYRWPAIKKWIDEYQPKLFIGVGNSFRTDFSKAVFGKEVEMKPVSFSVNNYVKNIFLAQNGWRKLAVIPHLSGGPNGLNSDQALAQAGQAIGDFMRNGL